MTTLRVFLAAAPAADRDAEWALFDAAGHVVKSGRGSPAEWPRADAVDAIIAADRGRLCTLKLPPLPAARAGAAARYALEDQLAGTPEDNHVALAAQGPDGTVGVAIIADDWMRAFVAASRRLGIGWRHAVLESDLALPPAGAWRWCAESIARPGFVRTGLCGSIAVGPVRDDALPDELAVALAQSGKRTATTVRVDAGGVTGALLGRWREQSEVDFIAGKPWRWYDAPPAAFAGGIDLLCGPYGAAPSAPKVDIARLFRPAAWIVAAAIAVHVTATTSEWLWLHWQSAQTERELRALARTVVPDAPADASPALSIARRDGELRHRAGLPANDDLLPLLARAAPALATLPAGTIRAISYVDGHLMLELTRLEPSQPGHLQQELQRLGLVAIAAPTATGARLRLGLD